MCVLQPGQTKRPVGVSCGLWTLPSISPRPRPALPLSAHGYLMTGLISFRDEKRTVSVVLSSGFGEDRVCRRSSLSRQCNAHGQTGSVA